MSKLLILFESSSSMQIRDLIEITLHLQTAKTKLNVVKECLVTLTSKT